MTDDHASAGPARSGRRITLRDVQNDWRVLDDPDFRVPEGVRLMSHEQFTSVPELEVAYVPPGRLARWTRRFAPLYDLLYAVRLLIASDSNTVLILDGRQRLALLTALLNALLYRGRRLTLNWGCMVEVEGSWKRSVMRTVMKGMSLSVLWSRAQIPAHAAFLDFPENRFAFIPYKANHSKGARYVSSRL